MSNANYVLKITEDIDVYKNPSSQGIKKAVLIVLVVLLIASFLLGENLFGELSYGAKVLLIVLVCGVSFSGKKETQQFPLELHFYNDRIEIHRLEVHYSNGDVKREFYVFRYENSPICVYSKRTRFTKIKGMVHGEWYKYTKTGAVADKAERIRDMEGICYFRVSASCGINLPDILRERTPIKVEIEK